MAQPTTSAIEVQHDTFLTFVQQYSRLIRHTIWRVCGEGSPDLQADIEQEVYLTLWERWAADRRIDYPVAYLYKVALRTALAVLRSSPAAPATVPVEEAELGALGHHTLAEDTTLTTEHAMLLTACLEQLPVDQGRAVRAYLAGFTQRDIAQLYGWSGAVTRHRIYRGLQALKTFAMQEGA